MTLGDYDAQRHAFPFKTPAVSRQTRNTPAANGIEVPASLTLNNAGRNTGAWRNVCPVAAQLPDSFAVMPRDYGLSMSPIIYKELPMDEASARKYIDSSGSQRGVFLAVDFTILPDQPDVARDAGGIVQATFHARPARVRVMSFNNSQALGTLFDDGTVGPRQVAAAPSPEPAPPPKKNDQFAFGDRMYEIRASTVVSLEADACGWPLLPEQKTNLDAFLQRVSRGSYSEKEQYYSIRARVTQDIGAGGRRDFCADPAHRREFDKLAARIAPRGTLAQIQ